MSGNTSSARLTRLLYAATAVVIAVLLLHLGHEPWSVLRQHGAILALVSAVAACGIVIQALSFRSVLAPGTDLSMRPLLRIWSMSGLWALAVPLIASLGARTALLANHGVPVSEGLIAGIRQTWLGLEYAVLVAAASALFADSLPVASLSIAIGCLLAWMFLRGFRALAHRVPPEGNSRLAMTVRALSTRPSSGAAIWFPAQLVAMAVSYALVFRALGADLNFADALVLAALTVVGTVVVLVPNGLGIFDALWVAVGMHGGLDLHTSVAAALSFRISFIAGAAGLLAVLAVIRNQPRAAV